MDLHLTRGPHEQPPYLRIFLEGVLVCEYAIGQVETQDALATEVREARALRALAAHLHQWQAALTQCVAQPDHIHTTPAARQLAFARGLEAGLTGATRAHPQAGLPPLPPEDTPSYRRGYAHGEALARALALLPQREAVPHGS